MDKGSFGRRLRQLRLAAGLSQTALAKAANVSQSKISQWEQGRAVALVVALPALAAVLGCTVDDLFADPDPERT